MKAKYYLVVVILFFSVLSFNISFAQTFTVNLHATFYHSTLTIASIGKDSVKMKKILAKLYTTGFSGKVNAYYDSLTWNLANLRKDKNPGELVMTLYSHSPDSVKHPNLVTLKGDTVIYYYPSMISFCRVEWRTDLNIENAVPEILAIGPGYVNINNNEQCLWFRKKDIDKVLTSGESKWLFAMLSKK